MGIWLPCLAQMRIIIIMIIAMIIRAVRFIGDVTMFGTSSKEQKLTMRSKKSNDFAAFYCESHLAYAFDQ